MKISRFALVLIAFVVAPALWYASVTKWQSDELLTVGRTNGAAVFRLAEIVYGSNGWETIGEILVYQNGHFRYRRTPVGESEMKEVSEGTLPVKLLHELRSGFPQRREFKISGGIATYRYSVLAAPVDQPESIEDLLDIASSNTCPSWWHDVGPMFRRHPSIHIGGADGGGESRSSPDSDLPAAQASNAATEIDADSRLLVLELRLLKVSGVSAGGPYVGVFPNPVTSAIVSKGRKVVPALVARLKSKDLSLDEAIYIISCLAELEAVDTEEPVRDFRNDLTKGRRFTQRDLTLDLEIDDFLQNIENYSMAPCRCRQPTVPD
jgi:hypothetical protein